MPGFFSSNKRALILEHPKTVALVAWGASTFLLLLPVCIQLSSLASRKGSAKDSLNESEQNYDEALKNLTTANANLIEAQQRLVDLDCVMKNYRRFNDRLIDFQQTLDDAVESTSLDRLKLIWDVNFVADTTTHDERIDQKSWSESILKYEYYYGRHGSSVCGKASSFCYAWNWHRVTETHHYVQVTRIENQYKSIVNGNGFSIEPLNCGYYSRELQITPETYMVSQSTPITSGSRLSGAVFVDFTRQYGSRIAEYLRLDELRSTTMALVSREATRAFAANELATELYKYLAASIATFNITKNYSQMQQQINNTVPGLIGMFHQANVTAQEKELVLAQNQQTFDGVDADYKAGLSLWLPLLLLIPSALALLTFFVIHHFKKIEKSVTTSDNITELQEVHTIGGSETMVSSSSI